MCLRLKTGLATVALGALVGCSSGGGGDSAASNTNGTGNIGGQTGTLTIGLIDSPRFDVDQIWVELDSMAIKPEDGEAIEFDFDPNITIDLLTLDADNAELLLDGAVVPAGKYNWIRFDVNAEFDGNLDSWVREIDGGMQELQVELRVPSGDLRLVSGFTVTANQETSFLIDWDARKGLVKPPGQPGFMLRPAFRIIDMTAFGTLSGMVAMDLITPATEDNLCDADGEDPDIGNIVYVFEGHGATPDDIDGIEADTDPNLDPVATIEVSQKEADYVYSAILSPGDYTVAFTCQGGLDDPEADELDLVTEPAPDPGMLFTEGVDITIEADAETVVDFGAF
jgi:hypothetical protein